MIRSLEQILVIIAGVSKYEADVTALVGLRCSLSYHPNMSRTYSFQMMRRYVSSVTALIC